MVFSVWSTFDRSAGKQSRRLLLAAWFLLVVTTLSSALVNGASVHTVFCNECTTYFNWQALGFFHSHQLSAQPGPVTRLVSCSPEQLKSWADVGGMPTHIAPSYTVHPRTGDVYSAYNKPAAVIDWLKKAEPKEDYILILDADMIMREPFDPVAMGVKPGTAVSADYSYLIGVANRLAEKHVPEVEPRRDTIAGPYGRRGDQVGGFIFMHREDLKRMAPLWLKYSEDVRADPEAWNLTGDQFATKPGIKPWISEMYGYSFGAAKAGVWHKTDHTALLYPGYLPKSPPKILHYGLKFGVPGTNFEFDKHWHTDFDAARCPPWGFNISAAASEEKRMEGGLFRHPPLPSSLQTQGRELLRDLLAIQTVNALNEAFCEHHRLHCPPSRELESECGQTSAISGELEEGFRAVEATLAEEPACKDYDDRCGTWAGAGECNKNARFMEENCALSCKLCQPEEASGPAPGEEAPVVRPPSTSPTAPLVKAANVKVAEKKLSYESEAESLGLATEANARREVLQSGRRKAFQGAVEAVVKGFGDRPGDSQAVPKAEFRAPVDNPGDLVVLADGSEEEAVDSNRATQLRSRQQAAIDELLDAKADAGEVSQGGPLEVSGKAAGLKQQVAQGLAGDSDAVRASRSAQFKAPEEQEAVIRAPLVRAGGGSTFGEKDEVPTKVTGTRAGSHMQEEGDLKPEENEVVAPNQDAVKAPVVRAGGGRTYGQKDDVIGMTEPERRAWLDARFANKPLGEAPKPAAGAMNPAEARSSLDDMRVRDGGSGLNLDLQVKEAQLDLGAMQSLKARAEIPDGHKLLAQRRQAIIELENRVAKGEHKLPVSNPSLQLQTAQQPNKGFDAKPFREDADRRIAKLAEQAAKGRHRAQEEGRLKTLCHSNAALSMAEVKDCLAAARLGLPFAKHGPGVSAQSHPEGSGGGNGAGKRAPTILLQATGALHQEAARQQADAVARQLKGLQRRGAKAGLLTQPHHAARRSRLSPTTATGFFLWASAAGLLLAASLPRVRRRVFGIRPKRTRHHL